MQSLRNKYTKGPIVCENGKEHCDHLVLGGIVQVLEGIIPDKVSIEELYDMLQNKKISRLCGGRGCGIWYELKNDLEMVAWSKRSLELSNYLPRP